MKDIIWKGTTKLTGPLSLYFITLQDGRKIYIFGEDHSKNGDSVHTYVPHQVLDTMADKSLDILLELSNEYAIYMSDIFKSVFSVSEQRTSLSPIMYISNRYYLQPNTISKNHSIKYIDTRRLSPFVLLTSIYDFDTYVYVFHRLNYRDKTPALKAVKTMYKAFERDLFAHIKTRVGLRSLLMALIHPEHEIPAWYKKWLVKTNHSYENIDNILKTELADLKKKNVAYYEGILSYIDYELTTRLDNIRDFSARFLSADEQRNTSASSFIMNKKQTVENFFKALIGILADIYIILCIVKNTSDTVVFVGESHVQPICRFYKHINSIRSIEAYTKCAEHDYLDYDCKRSVGTPNV